MTDQATPIPTPDNTPLPGGGSWRWDETALGWVPNAAHTALPEPTPTAEPAATEPSAFAGTQE